MVVGDVCMTIMFSVQIQVVHRNLLGSNEIGIAGQTHGILNHGTLYPSSSSANLISLRADWVDYYY
jgi:hypothetical protein